MGRWWWRWRRRCWRRCRPHRECGLRRRRVFRRRKRRRRCSEQHHRNRHVLRRRWRRRTIEHSRRVRDDGRRLRINVHRRSEHQGSSGHGRHRQHGKRRWWWRVRRQRHQLQRGGRWIRNHRGSVRPALHQLPRSRRSLRHWNIEHRQQDLRLDPHLQRVGARRFNGSAVCQRGGNRKRLLRERHLGCLAMHHRDPDSRHLRHHGNRNDAARVGQRDIYIEQSLGDGQHLHRHLRQPGRLRRRRSDMEPWIFDHPAEPDTTRIHLQRLEHDSIGFDEGLRDDESDTQLRLHRLLARVWHRRVRSSRDIVECWNTIRQSSVPHGSGIQRSPALCRCVLRQVERCNDFQPLHPRLFVSCQSTRHQDQRQQPVGRFELAGVRQCRLFSPNRHRKVGTHRNLALGLLGYGRWRLTRGKRKCVRRGRHVQQQQQLRILPGSQPDRLADRPRLEQPFGCRSRHRLRRLSSKFEHRLDLRRVDQLRQVHVEAPNLHRRPEGRWHQLHPFEHRRLHAVRTVDPERILGDVRRQWQHGRIGPL